MSATRLTMGQGAQSKILNPGRESISRVLRALDYEQRDAYLIFEWQGASDYFQALRTPHGYLVECRFFDACDETRYLHFRAWNCSEEPFDAGPANPFSGEHGPWARERDFVSFEETELVFHLLTQQRPIGPPALSGLAWRDVTTEFPNYREGTSVTRH